MQKTFPLKAEELQTYLVAQIPLNFYKKAHLDPI